MKIIGVTGNTGSGKSTISKILGDMDACVIYADEISHNVILKGEPAYEKIISLFGKEILDDAGEINRKKLGGIVFTDKEKLDCLSKIIHHYVILETKNIIEREKSRREIIIIDAPLLIEAGMHKICDEVWLVHAENETRLRRIMQRDSLTEMEALLRMNNQTPFEQLKPFATRIIQNDSDKDELLEQVKNVLCC